MYQSNGREELVELKDTPVMEAGAPEPLVIDAYDGCVLAYRTRGDDDRGGPIALVTFKGGSAVYSGGPNDEALQGHPLWVRGLRSYTAYEVLNSAWREALREMNRVHDRHSDARFDRLRHFIWTFHDTTFECLADSYGCSTLVETHVHGTKSLLKTAYGLEQ